MTTYYQVNILSTGAVCKIAYRGGRFLRVERVSGKLTDLQIKQLGRIIPPKQDDVSAFAKAYSDKITYTEIIKEKSTYTRYLDSWMTFYQDLNDMKPKFHQVEGAALKKIIAYLKEITGSDQAGLELWHVILHNWKLLDDFHQRNCDIKYINSQINKILQNVKRVNTKTSTGVSNDYLKSIINDLQT